MSQTIAQLQPKPKDRIEEEARILQPFDTSFEHIGKVLAALGTHCFIPTLPTPTQRLKQALRAASHPPTIKSLQPMNAADIRAQLEQPTATGTASTAVGALV